MERKAKFTRGPLTEWRSGSDLCVSNAQNHNFVATVGSAIADEPDAACIKADAALIVSAFNAATACEDMGYDGEACVKALPELVEAIMDAEAQCTQAIRILPYDEGCQAIHDGIRPMLRNILAKFRS